jgi:hypothetical protein
MIAREKFEDLCRQADELREALMRERAEHLARVEEINSMLAKLPGSGVPAVSLDEYRKQRKLFSPEAIGRRGAPINSGDVLHATATFFGYPASELTGQNRHASLTRARHIAMYLARKVTGESYPEIGRAFGNRDHTTVIDATRKIEEMFAKDAELRSEIETIECAIREAQNDRERERA